MLRIDNLDNPVSLFLENGSVFKVNSFKSKNRFTTNLFLVKHIDDNKNSLTLMLLKPCSLCTDEIVFKPVDEFITIDMSCLCGYQSIPNTCVRKCNHPPIQIKDCISGPFTILPGKVETVLWQSNVKANHYGSIKVCFEREKVDFLDLRIYFNNSTEHKTVQLIDQKPYNFSVADCSLMKIVSPNTKSKMKGTFEIKMNSEIRNEET